MPCVGTMVLLIRNLESGGAAEAISCESFFVRNPRASQDLGASLLKHVVSMCTVKAAAHTVFVHSLACWIAARAVHVHNHSCSTCPACACVCGWVMCGRGPHYEHHNHRCSIAYARNPCMQRMPIAYARNKCPACACPCGGVTCGHDAQL
jgi:hypothetical protein